MPIKLGSQVRDSITGLEGTVTGRAEYLHDTASCYVETRVVEDGKVPEGKWVTEGRLDVVTPAAEAVS